MNRVVIARFYDLRGVESSQAYCYFVPPHDVPKPGDMILTSISLEDYSSDKPNLKSAKIAIVETVVDNHPKATKFYLMLLPRERVLERYEEQRQSIEKAREMVEVQKRLDELLEKQSKVQQYEKLAETNPEAFVLLKKLKGDDVSEGVELPIVKPSRVTTNATSRRTAAQDIPGDEPVRTSRRR